MTSDRISSALQAAQARLVQIEKEHTALSTSGPWRSWLATLLRAVERDIATLEWALSQPFLFLSSERIAPLLDEYQHG